MGYFVAVLRERIASFEAPNDQQDDLLDIDTIGGVSINDLRKT